MAGLTAVYLLLFPRPMEKELIVAPAWALDTAGPAGRPGGPARPFLSGGRVGYYDPAGELLLSEPLVYGASIGAAAFVNYSRLPSSLVIKDTRGAFVAAVPAGGYPLLDAAGQRMLLVSRDAKGLTGVNRSGETLWRREFASVITCVEQADQGVLVGLLDGTLSLYDHAGRALYTLKPEGSRVPVVLGCAASDDALASVVGIDPQRLIVVGRSEGRFEPVADVTLPSDFRREVFVRFSESGGTVFFRAPRRPRPARPALPGRDRRAPRGPGAGAGRSAAAAAVGRAARGRRGRRGFRGPADLPRAGPAARAGAAARGRRLCGGLRQRVCRGFRLTAGERGGAP